MSLPICWRQSLRLAQRTKTLPSTSNLLPRAQRRGLADVVAGDGVIRQQDEMGSITIRDADIRSLKEEGNVNADLSPLLESLNPEQRALIAKARIPKNLQAMYNRPLKRKPTHGIPVCNLQIRSYSVRNLELQADFALRAAYYLGLPAKGPVPLPQITQRWTVPRSNFVHKKSQENFERVTVRRLIQIQDGDPDVVQMWLGYLSQRAYHGIGMKAYMWENEALGVGKRMDKAAGIADAGLESEWGNFGMRLNVKTAEAVEELLGSDAFSNPKKDKEARWREPKEIIRKNTKNATVKQT